MKEYLELGQIVSTHGIKGEVKVYPWCDSADFITEFDTVLLGKKYKEIDIENARSAKNMAILKLEGIDTVEQAQTLRGEMLYIGRDWVDLGENSNFIVDLIGLEAVDINTGESYGKLVEVTPTGANDVYHIKNAQGKIYLVPAVLEIVPKVDVEGGKVYIKPIGGLFSDED